MKKDNLLVKPTLQGTTAYKHEDQLAALKNVKISKTTTTTTTSMTITNKQFVSNEVQQGAKKENSNNSCMMEEDEAEPAAAKEPSEDVELEEEEDEDEDDEWVDDDEDEDEDVDGDEVLEERSSLEDVIDIDQMDGENPQLVAEYVKDIYKYLHQMERRFRISPTFLDNKIVTSKMRSVLIDWLIQVHLKFHLLQETLYLCVQIIDAYLQAQDVSKMQLQLVGVTAMFLASKYEEMYVPAIDDFVYMTDNTYTKSEIRQMEISILKTLNFMFGKPLPLHFLRRFSKAACVSLNSTSNLILISKYKNSLNVILHLKNSSYRLETLLKGTFRPQNGEVDIVKIPYKLYSSSRKGYPVHIFKYITKRTFLTF